MRGFGFSVLACLLAFLAAPAGAADIRLVNSYHGPCHAVLSGPIEPGDVDRLRAILPGDGTDAGYAMMTVTLCLNSPGGSFTEGLALARYLRQTGIGTHVAAGDECLSACALAFLGGTTLWFEDELVSFPTRNLHPLALLGFHAPQLELAPGQYSESDVTRAFGVALVATTEIFRRRVELGIAEDFALDFLARSGEDFLMIDTANALEAMNGALIVPHSSGMVALRPLPERISDTRLIDLCHRHAPATNPRSYDGARASSWHDGWIMDLPPGDQGEARRAYLAASYEEGMLRWAVCIIGWQPDRLAPERSTLNVVTIQPYQIESDRGSYDNPQPPTLRALQRQLAALDPQPWPHELPVSLASAPGTSLADLSRASPATERAIAYGSCDATAPRYRVHRVQQFSNMRAGPGFDAAVRREVPLNAPVAPVFDGAPHTAILSPECDNVCAIADQGRLQPEELDAIRACTWSNDVWWRVRGEDGTEGWMSSRFLTEG